MKENTKTKTVLGIDLGVASIGWAMIQINKNTSDDNLEGNPEDEFEQIIALGSRIVPIDTNIKNDFTKGTGESKNHIRTMTRTSRKVFYRYTLRRKQLSEFLQKLQILPEKALFELKTLDLYELRAKALKQQISLQEIGRIFFHLNQKRGYKSAKINAEEATEEKPKAKKEGAEKTYLEKNCRQRNHHKQWKHYYWAIFLCATSSKS